MLIQPGKPWYEFRDDLIEANQYFNFSMAFHWTPDQIRSLSEEDKMRYVAQLKGMGSATPPKR